MTDIHIPGLFYPFAPAAHPHIEQSERECVDRWAKKLGLQSIQQMTTITNDTFSLAGDMRDVGHLNLVLSVWEHVQPELQDAVETAAKMHDAEMEQSLPSFGEQDAAVARFARGMRANYDSSIRTGRYTEPEAAPTVGMAEPLISLENSSASVQMRPRNARGARREERQEETKALLRDAALRLEPRNWLTQSGEARSDAGFDAVRSRYQHWLERSPFHTAPPASWRMLVDLSISYASHTYRPEGGVRYAEAEALVSWLTCFWKLDNIVDDCVEGLPANYLDALRKTMWQAWHGDDTQRANIPPADASDLLAFHDQAVALLIEHRRQMRALGHPVEDHPEYRDAVWRHIVCQTEAPPQIGSLQEYIEMRRARGGMECVFQMLLALQGIEWHASLAPIIDLANIATCLVDDLFSCVKDERDGVPSAISISGPDGLLRVLSLVRWLHQELLELLELRLAADDSESAHLLVRTVLDVVLGMIEWQSSIPRYRAGAQRLAGLLLAEFARSAPRQLATSRSPARDALTTIRAGSARREPA